MEQVYLIKEEMILEDCISLLNMQTLITALYAQCGQALAHSSLWISKHLVSVNLDAQQQRDCFENMTGRRLVNSAGPSSNYEKCPPLIIL